MPPIPAEFRRHGENMNATAFGNKPPEIVTPEKLLFDAAERVGRIREGRQALHLHLSRLLARNRDDARVRIAFRMFETMADQLRGQMFLLSNHDIVLICKEARAADLDAIVYRLRALFSQDPLSYADAADDQDRFASIHDLGRGYDEFFAVCTALLAAANKRHAEGRDAPPPPPLDAHNLGLVEQRIGTIDIARVIRRQPCVRFQEKATAEVEFQEFHVSIAELQQVLAPDINLLANRWLFLHLSQALDLRVLSTLGEAEFRKLPAIFSLNLNLSTLESPEFARFEAALRGRAGLMVEVQPVDVFNDLDGFFRARDSLRNRGHKTVLDGLSALSLQFMDAGLYGCDFVKLHWSPDMTDDLVASQLHHALDSLGRERVVLARCDSQKAVAWGLAQGIRRFQGHFLDARIAAVTMAQCDKAAACTPAQCHQRHDVISGPLRAECGNTDMLDLFPPLRAFH